MMSRKPIPVYLVFFLSGIAGLIYQVMWVRLFGNVFGNTTYSASVVTAVFLAGLGLGGYLAGRISDRLFKTRPDTPLLLYGIFELLIGGLGIALAFVLPKLSSLSVSISSYVVNANNFNELSLWSHVSRYLFGILLLAFPAMLMGGTLTLLIRFVVARQLNLVGLRVGFLYGINTLGAALGCILSDFVLVPRIGIFNTQLSAAILNWIAGIGGLVIYFYWRQKKRLSERDAIQEESHVNPEDGLEQQKRVSHLTALALFFAGFGAMGLEIAWFRYLISVMGGYRAVFSLLLFVILLGIWLGAMLGGYLHRRWKRPVLSFLLAQYCMVVFTLLLFMLHDGEFSPEYLEFLSDSYFQAGAIGRKLWEIWAHLQIIIPLVAVPAICMGLTFPLGNAIVQRAEASVGHRAGKLYLASTTGNFLGSLLTGFVVLPLFGMQSTVAIVSIVALMACIPLYKLIKTKSRQESGSRYFRLRLVAYGLIVVLLSFGTYALLPRDFLVLKAFHGIYSTDSDQKVVTVNEGVHESLMVVENTSGVRKLYTNGHLMSATGLRGQRYMRAFAHLPLMLSESPRVVLVICFGVGNTLHAASLHPGLEKLEVVDLSEAVLAHAKYFRMFNGDVLNHPKVEVFVNDGRHHLLMQEADSYDLITLEAPPIAFAGVSSLYTKEFYQLVRSRLRAGGYLTQWFPVYQLSETANLSLVRAFVEIFPDAVLLSGFDRDLILMGRKGSPIVMDIDHVESYLASASLVKRDLENIQMGTLTDIAGTYASSGQRLAKVSENSQMLEDNFPIIEYSIQSSFVGELGIPRRLFDVSQAHQWCPKCFSPTRLSGNLADLPAYLEYMAKVYSSNIFLLSRPTIERKGMPIEPFQDEDDYRLMVKYPYLRTYYWKKTRG